MNAETLLLANGYVYIPAIGTRATGENTDALVGTVLGNLARYGFVPNIASVEKLRALSEKEIKAWWPAVEVAMQAVTGASREMGKFVVYKNFPRETLAMSEAEWVIKQILMYIGFPNAMFTEEEKSRPQLLENVKLKSLALANPNTFLVIAEELSSNAARWSDNQEAWAKFLYVQPNVIDLENFKFKENGIVLAADAINTGAVASDIKITNATDVLRLCAALSGGDVSLRETVRFRRFKRSERRLLLGILEQTKNIAEDFAMRKEQWKRVLAQLHPGDYNFPRVTEAYNSLYKGEVKTFNAKVDPQVKTVELLDVLKSRPGEFVRRFHHFYDLFGQKTVEAFKEVIPSLKTGQLVNFRAYINSVNHRTFLTYAPKGNWTRLQVVPNTKRKLTVTASTALNTAIHKELKARMKVLFPKGVALDSKTTNVKLQRNDQKLAEYGRGTTFDIPANITFLRSASYWACPTNGNNVWYDNGWNFLDSNWTDMGAVAWNEQQYRGAARGSRNAASSDISAVFSGDPTNSKDLKGRACQMADLYIDKLVAAGIRYAVWNVLCYSRKSFDEAEEVLATLQMGENAEEGKLYEPSRAQMVFPLKGNAFSKYVAYIDLVERKIVYIDANLRANVMSATNNGEILAEKMPAYLEYLKSIPSVADLFADANKGSTPVLFTDENVKIGKGKKAYVFRPTNPSNVFEKLSLDSLM